MKRRISGLRERNKQDKLRRIKRAAAELFVSKGYDETTIREVAARAGVGLGTVFVYAATKRDLLFLTVNEDLEAVVNRAAAARRAGRPMLESLLAIFEGYYHYFATEPRLARLSLREMTFYAEGPEAERFLRMREGVIALLEETVQVAILRKEIAPRDGASLVAWVVFAIYQVEVRRWLSSDKLSVKAGVASLRRLLKMMITGLAADSDRRR